MNTTDRQSVRQKLLNAGFTEMWLNEMCASEYLYFTIDLRKKSFHTMKYNDFQDEMSYRMHSCNLELYSSDIFRARFPDLAK